MRSTEEKELLAACYWNKFDEIKALLSRGVSPQFTVTGYPERAEDMDNYKTPMGELMTRLNSERHLEAVDALLDAGADVNAPTDHTVSRKYTTALGKALLAHINDRGMTLPAIQEQVVRRLLARGARVTQLSEDALATFMAYGSSRLLELLLNAGLNPSTVVQGKALLEYVIDAWPISWGNTKADMAKLLINKGADLSMKDAHGRSLAQRAHRPDLVNLLLEKEKDSCPLDALTLHDGAILRSPQLLQKLIARGDNINALNQRGNTPLMEAATHGHTEAAFILMEAGAEMNVSNPNGETALHLAMANALSLSNFECDYADDTRYPIALELYSRGAVPSLDRNGRTPLMRCHFRLNHYAALRFCTNEFSKFEAQYYDFDSTEYAQEMFAAYQPYMKDVGHAFGDLPIQEQPEHVFLTKLKRVSAPLTTMTREELVNDAKKLLLIALDTNNATVARAMISRFPEIDLNQLKDEKGQRPFSIVIRSVAYSKESCLALLELLFAHHVDVNLADDTKEKDTPLLACVCNHHYLDLQSMTFLLNHRANPNIGNAEQETPLHRAVATFRKDDTVERAIELLLQHRANPDAVSNKGKKPIEMIVLSWESNRIPAIFERFKKMPVSAAGIQFWAKSDESPRAEQTDNFRAGLN